MLRTRYVTSFIKGGKPSIKNLNRQLICLNIVNLIIEASILAYFIIIMVQLKNYYDSFGTQSGTVLSDLIQRANYFVGSIMIVCFAFIILSYGFLRQSFIQSTNLQGSQYKETLQNGFALIALAYMIRSIYSWIFPHVAALLE